MKFLLALLLLNICWLDFAKSQTTYTLSGQVTDAATNELLVGASVLIQGTNKGSITDIKGKYTLDLSRKKSIIIVSFVGYHTIIDTVELFSNKTIDYKLRTSEIEIDDIIVSARNPDKNINKATTSYIELNNKEIKQLPSLMGEADVLRLLQLSPGVQSANEGNAGFYVRGGGSDQNLILMDNAPVHNPSHVLGFFSVFNSDVVRDVTLIKSGMPAKYGGRMSSIVDLKTIEPDYNKPNLYASIGLISSRITIDAPIIKNKISFFVAFRKSYIDDVFKPLVRSFVKTESSFYNYSKYSFYDLNAKVSVNISKKDKLTISFYNGRDNYKLEQDQLDFKNQMNWGNSLITTTYTRTINDNWYMDNSFYYSNYQFHLSANQLNVDVKLMSFIEDYGYKFILNKITNKNTINVGIDYQFHHFVPNKLDAQANGLDLNFGLDRNLFSHEIALFYNHEYRITERFAVNSGLRFSYYLHTGPYSELIRNSVGETIDTVFYKPNDIIHTYSNLEPRLTLLYQLTTNTSIKASYTRHVQYVHLASASSISLPTDVWLPSTNMIKPQKSDHYTLGYYLNTKNKNYTSSIEAYYKNLYNQIELLHGIINDFQDKIFEESMIFGTGKSYGLEFYIKKIKGKATGWLSYTISKSIKMFEEISNGTYYPADFDRPHDFNFVFNYSINKNWAFSGTFIYATGKPITIPEYFYLMSGNFIASPAARNSFRMPPYHRLDISLTYNFEKNRYFESSLNFSVYNVYNRANPYFIYFEITADVEKNQYYVVPKQVTLFPIIPSISYSIKF